MKTYWKWKTCFKSGNESFFRTNVLPKDTMVQDMHKMLEKGRIKPCNVSFNMVDSLRNYGKTVNQLLLEYISAKIEI